MKVHNSEIIKFLVSSKGWVTAADLANHFNVSAKTIRNKINTINQEKKIIISSYHGYKISNIYEQNSLQHTFSDEKDDRLHFILRHLLQSHDLISVYDLADLMYISDSQFERELQQVKKYLKTFNLNIYRKRNLIQIEGIESNKRLLIYNLIHPDTMNAFFNYNQLESFFNLEGLDDFRFKIKHLFEQYNILVNDYGFYTIFMHIIIMLFKPYKDNEFLSISYISLTSKEFIVANEISKLIYEEKKISISNSETINLSVIISNYSNSINPDNINKENIEMFIDKEYIILTQDILNELAEIYYLEPFSNDFILNLSLHIKNLINRSEFDTYTVNPLASKFKYENALIYDMATFVIKRLNNYKPFKIIDDEIAFIAFHIGSYIENSEEINSKIHCCFIYADYHNMYTKAIEKINKHLNSIIYISKILSIKDLNKLPNNIDLIISCCGDVSINDIPVITTSVFISNFDISNIYKKIELINEKKKQNEFKKDFKHFIKKELFKRNFYTNTVEEMIQVICNDCFTKKLVDIYFVNEVLEREKLSSTSFNNGVAIPHSLNNNARRSFIYVVSNTKGMKWGNNIVNIIVLIGVSKNDRKAFKIVFNGLIELLYEKNNIRNLIKQETYDQFIEVIMKTLDYKSFI